MRHERQDRSGGPSWLFASPILGVSSISALAADRARVGADSGAEEPGLAELPEQALRDACEGVLAAVNPDDDEGTVTVSLANPTPWFLQLIAMPYASVLDREWMVEQGDWDGSCNAAKRIMYTYL